MTQPLPEGYTDTGLVDYVRSSGGATLRTSGGTGVYGSDFDPWTADAVGIDE
jgi:hypothetical protein